MTNYIEIRHEYTDSDGDHYIDTRWAVKPTADEWCSGSGERVNLLGGISSWVIEPGGGVHIYDQSDIDGLRKLLDAIEEQMKDEDE